MTADADNPFEPPQSEFPPDPAEESPVGRPLPEGPQVRVTVLDPDNRLLNDRGPVFYVVYVLLNVILMVPLVAALGFGGLAWHQGQWLWLGPVAACFGLFMPYLKLVAGFAQPALHRLYWRPRLRDTLLRRPDRVIDPYDPEARLVEIVPREHWQRTMLESASDFGLLKIDGKGGRVLFEGGGQRWVVPPGAIVGVRTMALSPGERDTEKERGLVYFALLHARGPDGTLWEQPICLAAANRLYESNAAARRQCERLVSRLHDLHWDEAA